MFNADTDNFTTILDGRMYGATDMRDIEVYRDKFLFISGVRNNHLLR